MDIVLPFHDSFGFHRLVAVKATELAFVLLDCRRHTVGQVLPAVSDHVPMSGYFLGNIFVIFFSRTW